MEKTQNKIYEILEINLEIKKNIDLKGFYMYKWISFEELRLTVTKDYLFILSKILLLFWIVFILIWLWDFYINESLFMFFIMVLVLYWILFLLIIIRMIYRSWVFTHISNIFFTNTHISIWWEIIEYNNFYKIEEDIKHWEELFDEEMMKPSKINEKISEFKAKVFSWSAEKQEKKAENNSSNESNDNIISSNKKCDKCWDCWSAGCDCWDGWEWAIAFVIITFILIWLYWISIRVFYAIWWILSFLIWHLFVWIMKKIIYFQDREELKINSLFEKIENISNEIIFSKNILKKKILEASVWNWSEWINWIVSNFDNTIWKAWLAIWLKNKLKFTLSNSKFKDIFNFTTYNLWTKNQVLEPINEIIFLLNSAYEKLQKTIIDLENQIKITDKSLIWPMEIQLIRLKKQEEKFLIIKRQWAWIWSKIVLQDF